jgi:hypothetical protein
MITIKPMAPTAIYRKAFLLMTMGSERIEIKAMKKTQMI